MDQEEAEQAASYSELYQAILLLSREQRVAVTLFYIVLYPRSHGRIVRKDFVFYFISVVKCSMIL